MSSHTYIKVLRNKKFSAPYVSAVNRYSQPLKSNNLPIILSLKHLAVLSDISYTELYSIVHRTIDHYRIFSIKKKSGGNRWISVPSSGLMKLQRWINENILYSKYVQDQSSSCAMAYIKNTGRDKKAGHIKNAEKHHDCDEMVKVDVTRFFESISERQVFHAFKNLGYRPYVSFVLTRVCTRILYSNDVRRVKDSKRWSSEKEYKFGVLNKHHDKVVENQSLDGEVSFDEVSFRRKFSRSVGHLPQGAPTSPMLANLVCARLDEHLYELATTLSLIYTRYADDIVFSGDIGGRLDATVLIRQISKELREDGFKVNFQKTRYCKSGTRMIVTGICINDADSLRVPREYKDNIKQEIYYLKKYKIDGHCQRKGVKNPLAYLMRLEGKIRYVSSIESDRGRVLMNAFEQAVPEFESLKQFYE